MMNTWLRPARRIPVLCIALALAASCRQERPPASPDLSGVKHITDSILRLDSAANALRFTDTTAALARSTRAVSLARATGSSECLIKALNTKGMLRMANHPDSAMQYFYEALRMTDSLPWKAERGAVFYNLARMYLAVNDHKNATVLLDSSVHAGIRTQRPAVVCAALLALGTIQHTADDPEKAAILYDSALRMAHRHHQTREGGVALGNLALYRSNPREAVALLRKAVQELEKVQGAEAEQAEFLQNIGYFQANPDSAMHYYSLAIRLAERFGIRQAVVAAYNNMAYAFLDRKDPIRAAECLTGHALPAALAMQDDSWLATVYDTYADVLIAEKKYSDAVTFLRKSKEAGIRADKRMAKNQVRMLNALLEMKNKNLLIMEQERRLSLNDIHISRLWSGLAIAGLLLVILAGGWIGFRLRTTGRIQRMKLESARRVIEAEEHEKERTGMELHDAAGNLSWQIHEAFDRHSGFSEGLRTAIVSVISAFNDDIRNLSHRLNKKMLEKRSPEDLFGELCRLAIRTGQMNLIYRIGTPISPVPVPVITHLFRITQELLNNARKHAPGAAIHLTIGFERDRVRLEYRDDGPGFDPAGEAAQGMGISNIFARTDLLNGKAVLDAEPGFGVSWEILVHF